MSALLALLRDIVRLSIFPSDPLLSLSGIARLVSDAQSREAPVQRLADAVAGRFCYTVMAASAATLGFWSAFGVHAFPGVVEDIMFAGKQMQFILHTIIYTYMIHTCIICTQTP